MAISKLTALDAHIYERRFRRLVQEFRKPTRLRPLGLNVDDARRLAQRVLVAERHVVVGDVLTMRYRYQLSGDDRNSLVLLETGDDHFCYSKGED